ncbi:kinesin-domain-containing protein [Tuber magnatum]|uniref:Kinesin-domain-containing protein n=1 Tax=Tuber magnatum TaxID=42249 RepID=A0A317SVH2_9PEZI|nr:kinesin-domain-containing protein [Tuber magnatum]
MVGTPTSPASPPFHSSRPMSAVIRPARSSSRLSMSSRAGGSRSSDEDARTSVKVAVRVRPPLRSTDPGFDLIPQRFQRGMVHVTSPTSLAVDSPQGRKIFVFDRVFGQEVDQNGIWDYLEESVNAFVQGYNVSLLAYGQSGAGKSYTMGTSGPDEQSNVKVMGVIPRAAAALFERLGSGAPNSRNSTSGLRAPMRYSTPISQLIKPAADKGWTMKASYVEIYNEQLRDLLLPEGTRPEERVPITIREDTKGRILLTGLHQVIVNTVDDLLGALNFGSSIRQTDATAINAKSSRSHAVFSLNLVQRKPRGPASKDEKRFSMPTEMLGQEGYVTVDSKMHFVDLAGSERLKNTLAQGDRAKEGISINAGLASLGKVISQLSSRQAGSHVSYRDSKLTRLLQDSLGGNAITYMIACVTPAEFHLSETLNTVQYAQRARAIQSKPRIQQVSDDGDMKALVERLRAEIAFLRDQLKNHSESSGGTSSGGQTRSERSSDKEREMELQNQLLDLQENYGALSQRHAKLISEITKVRDTQELSAQPNDYADSAEDRLARSNSLSVAVEQVVLEYEKTIQSLETSLSSTRGLLSANESCLLEKETKLAYIETVNQQLHARVQKMMDRESSTENYLHDLETKLDSHTSGEEKNAAIIAELRKEIARIRENEAGCEDYISTLEERLAEADQDMELMQREIDRLEHVVDRQRSLGKLDNLLYELDSMNSQKEEKPVDRAVEVPEKMRNGRARPHSDDTLVEVPESVNGGDEFVDPSGGKLQAQENRMPVSTTPETGNRTSQPAPGKVIPSITLEDSPQIEYPPQSPAQSQFVADKLESVQQELIDLKVEHEATINEYDQMSANYEAALRDIAVLQDRLDEARHKATPSQGTSPPPSPNLRPTSFLVGARVSDLRVEEQDTSSLSLSSELSLVGDSPISPVSIDSEAQRIKEELEIQRKISQEREEALASELEGVKIQMEEALKTQEEEHDLLHLQLKQSLDQLSELRHRERVSGVISPSGTHILRRKSSQSLAILDRARRSFDNLHRIAVENFKEDPEILENFGLNIDAALKELTTRSDRILELETEIASLRKEMDAKSAIINGLARERSSISTSPMDISVVVVMERRIEETQAQLNSTRELLAIRESDLAIAHRELSAQSGESTSDVEELLIELTKERTMNAEKSQRISDLQREIVDTRQNHDIALGTINCSKKALATAVHELEGELARSKEVVEAERALKVAVEEEKIHHQERVKMLQKIVTENRATIDSQLARVAELEKTHAATREQIDSQLSQTSNASGLVVEEARKQQVLAKELEQTIAQNREVIEDQQARLTELEASYQDAIDQVEALRRKEEAATLALEEAEARASEEIAATNAKHEELVQTLRAKLEESKSAILEHVANLTRLQVSHAEAKSLIGTLEGDKSKAQEEAGRHAAAVKVLETEVEGSKATIKKHLDTISELQELHKQADKEIEKLSKKEAKHAKLLEDLEQQLTFTFDQNQENATKLADITAEYERLQQEKQALVAESTTKNAESQQLIEGLTDEVASLQTKLAEVQIELQGLGGARAQRSNSTSSNSNLRKSTSTTSLPSPPPAIPLPPLPANATSPVAGPAQPPPTPSMSRHPSKDYVVAHMEDQEARIKTLEKQLHAEKALTITLEEALTDCENKMKSLRSDRDSFQAKASQVQQELDRARNESQTSRYSMQAVEEERLARKKAELAREQLEVRMRDIAKKNKRSFACF